MRTNTHPDWLSIHLLLAALLFATILGFNTRLNAGELEESLTTNHPWIGEPAPNFELTSTSGEKMALSEFRGRELLVIHFAASW